MASRLIWYDSRVRNITTVIPQRAHDLASAQAAGLAARAVNSKGTGSLARDVSRPQRRGFLHSSVGSGRVYARIQNDGGTIHAKRNRMLIRGTRGSSRSTTGGGIVASATSVTIPGKHYLQVALGAFPRLFVAAMRQMMPR